MSVCATDLGAHGRLIQEAPLSLSVRRAHHCHIQARWVTLPIPIEVYRGATAIVQAQRHSEWLVRKVELVVVIVVVIVVMVVVAAAAAAVAVVVMVW